VRATRIFEGASRSNVTSIARPTLSQYTTLRGLRAPAAPPSDKDDLMPTLRPGITE